MFPHRRRSLLMAVLAAVLLLVAGCISETGTTSSSPADTVALAFYTEEHPPYSYLENGTLAGFAIDLVENLTARAGSPVRRDQIRLVPWSQAFQAGLVRNDTVVFVTARLPEREQLFRWVGPVTTDRNVLFARRDRGVAVRNVSDLGRYRIGVVAGDLGEQEMLNAGVSPDRLVRESNVSELARMLDSGEIDLWAYRELGGRYYAERETGNYYAFRVVHVFDDVTGYLAFNRNTSDATVARYQRALDGLKQERDAANVSTFDRILGRYVPSVGLAQLTYLTEEWAPFNYLENGTPAGLSVEVLEAVWKDLGVNLTRADIGVVPLSDAFARARNTTGTVVFSIVRTPEREPLYQWAGPFTRGNFVIWAPAERKIAITSDADLQRYRIGAVEGTIENTMLAERGYNESRVAHGKTPADLLRLLEAGEIDLWATGDLAGRYQMMQTARDPDAYEIVYTLSEMDFYYIFSRDVPDTLVSAFAHALDRAQNEKDARGVSAYERIIYRNLGVGCARPTFSDDAVTALVNTTATALEQDAAGTIRRINAGEAPYHDAANPALYVFVYDTNLTVVAHPNKLLVGENLRGTTDVEGTPFRDEIRTGAMRNGSGWQDYVYLQPGQMNLYRKTTYYLLVRGSDGADYIVCSGTYKRCR